MSYARFRRLSYIPILGGGHYLLLGVGFVIHQMSYIGSKSEMSYVVKSVMSYIERGGVLRRRWLASEDGEQAI